VQTTTSRCQLPARAVAGHPNAEHARWLSAVALGAEGSRRGVEEISNLFGGEIRLQLRISSRSDASSVRWAFRGAMLSRVLADE
jgi:hypothetical protein